MMTIVAIFFLAAVGFGLSRWLNKPVVPLLVLCGLLLQVIPDTLIDADLVEAGLMLGLAFLVFSAGTELNPRRSGAFFKASLVVGTVQFLALGGLGFVVAITFSRSPVEALYVALALAASSTLVVVQILRKRRQFFEPFGRIVVGVLLLQDALVIVLLSAVVRLEDGWLATLEGLFYALFLLALAIILMRFVTPWVLKKLGLDEESLLLVVLATLFAFVAASWWLGIPWIAGAFFAGVSLAGFPVHGLIRGQLTSLTDFFLAVFFVTLGYLLVVPHVADLIFAFLMIVVVFIATPLLITFVAEKAGVSARSSLEAGLLLAQTSEFSLVLVLLGQQLGQLSSETVSAVALVTVVTMFLTPLFATDEVTWRLMKFHPSRWKELPEGRVYSGHCIVIGCGESGQEVLRILRGENVTVIAIEDDPIVVSNLVDQDVPVLRGDGADSLVLGRAFASDASLIVSTMARVEDNMRLLSRIGETPALVRVFDQHEAEMIEGAGGMPLRFSDAGAEVFLEWFRKVDPQRTDRTTTG